MLTFSKTLLHIYVEDHLFFSFTLLMWQIMLIDFFMLNDFYILHLQDHTIMLFILSINW